MQTNHILHISTCQLLLLPSLLHWNEHRWLSKSIHNHPDGVIPFASLW